MPDRDSIPLSQVVSHAASLVDPEGTDPEVEGLVLAFEDDDRPARGLGGLREELHTSVEGLDPDEDSPAVRMAAAVAFHLAGAPEDERDREGMLRVAARVFYGDEVPELVTRWLEAEGVSL